MSPPSGRNLGEHQGERLVGLPPVVGRRTRLLLLGSFPGAASLAAGQYYAHPRNQFWPLLSALLAEDLVALDYRARLQRLRVRGLGLWDTIAECEREGSLDSRIRQPRYNDLASLRRRVPHLLAVAHNGGESARFMPLVAQLGLSVYRLPSSSPAHASWSFERKLAAWRAVFEACGLGPGSEPLSA